MKDESILIQAYNAMSKGKVGDLEVLYKQFSKTKELTSGTVKASGDGRLEIPRVGGAQFMSLSSRYLGGESFSTFNLPSFNKVNFNVFAESGSYVANIPVKMVVELRDEFDLPMKGVKIQLKSGNKVLYQFKTSQHGSGNFLMKPQEGVDYELSAIYDGEFHNYKLPVPEASGYSFVQRQVDENLVFNIFSTSKEVQTVYLLGHIRGEVQFGSMIEFKEEYTEGIPKKNMPDGILNTYMLNASGEIIAKNAVYISSKRSEEVVSFSQNGIVQELDLSNLTDGQVNVRSNLISASDTLSVDLESFFKFNSEVPMRYQALKLVPGSELAIRNTNFRYEWFENADYKLPKIPAAIGYDVISGKAFYRDEKPHANKNLVLYSQGEQLKSWFTKTDENGAFEFTEFEYYDSATLVISGTGGKKGKEVFFSVDGHTINHQFELRAVDWVEKTKAVPEHISYDSLIDLSNTIVLDNVTKEGARYIEAVEERREKLDRIRETKGDRIQGSTGGRFGILNIIRQVTVVYSANV